MSHATSSDASETSPQRRDALALALPPAAFAASAPVNEGESSAWIEGRPVSVDQALERAGALLAQAQAPALLGLAELTLEAQRAAVDLARGCHARIAPWPRLATRLDTTRSVTRGGSIGEACAADFVLKPGTRELAADHPIATEIARRTLHSLFIQPGLRSLLQLRAAIRQRGAQALRDVVMKPVQRIVVLLPADVDPVTASQWHRLADDVQDELRMSVLRVADLEREANARGMVETLLWEVGVDSAHGGVDFAHDPPTPCLPADRLLAAGAVDVALELGLPAVARADLTYEKVQHRIVISASPQARADQGTSPAVQILSPRLAPGLAGRIMRSDGQTLWLCDDPEQARPDPVPTWLATLTP